MSRATRHAARIALAGAAIMGVAGCGLEGDERHGPTPAPAAHPGVLLVSGQITPDHAALDPALWVPAAPSLPAEPSGRHRLRGSSNTGDVLFDLPFEGTAVVPADDPARPEEHFTFAIPMSPEEAASLATIELRSADGHYIRRTGTMTALELAAYLADGAAITAERLTDGRVRLRWDAGRFPLLLIREPDTGVVLSFSRGGETMIVTDAALLDVIVSEGVRSARVGVAVEG